MERGSDCRRGAQDSRRRGVLILAYVDSGLPIAAWRGDPEEMRKATEVFEDPSLTLVASAFLRLELAPHASSQVIERAFVERLLEEISIWVPAEDALVARAGELRTIYALAPLDSLHVAAAEQAGVERFLTLERPGKPIYRVMSVGPTYLLDL